MQLVFKTSKKIYVGEENFAENVRNNKPLIAAVWHNRLMMVPFISNQVKKINPDYKIVALASRHGDGQFVGKIVEKFGAKVVSGSTRNKNHLDRGITVSGFRRIFDSLHENSALVITPDGPRGPAQKINGKLLEISSHSQVPILPISVSASKFFRLNSWDRFYIPLPFSTLCYCFGKPINIPLFNKEELKEIHFNIEEKMNEIQEKSQIRL